MPWERVTSSAEVLAVHAAYMGFGKILYFGGDEFDPDHNKNHDFHNAARLFDCNDFTVQPVPSPDFDAFCCGHAFLGKAIDQVQLVAAGGTERWIFPEELPEGGFHHGHFPGLRDAAVFHTPNFSNPSGPGWDWEPAAYMNAGLPRDEPNAPREKTGGRWYPTLATLPNGDVIAFSGHPGSDDLYHNNFIPEVFSP